MDRTFPYGLIYGPHRSKRLGLSLGIDLTPMTCTFNCVYCERGKTLLGCRDQREFIPKVTIDSYISALMDRVIALRRRCDALTFSGTGEPTLDPRLGEFITATKKIIGRVPIKVITNSSLLTCDKVRANLTQADEVIAKFNAVSNNVFITIHRPFNETVDVSRILKGFHSLKKEIGSRLTLEILFVHSRRLRNTNSTEDEMVKLTQELYKLKPNKVHLHTVRRFPAEHYILPVSRRFLDFAFTFMTNRLPTTQVTRFHS